MVVLFRTWVVVCHDNCDEFRVNDVCTVVGFHACFSVSLSARRVVGGGAAPPLVDGSKDSPGTLSDQKKAKLLCLFKKSMK